MRKRLTARNLRAESQEEGLFPGDIGNEERSKNYHSPDEYSNYEFKEGWDIPDKTAPAIHDERDEIGFGIPKMADAYQTAKAAAILAQCYLGDDASDEAIEDQARDFMKLGYRRIRASIKRWKATESIEDESSKEITSSEDSEAGEDSLLNEQEKQEDTSSITKTSEKFSSEDSVDDISAKDEDEDEEEAPEMELEIPEAGEQSDANMFGAEGELNQAQADPELEQLFSDDPKASDDSVARCASTKAKQGIKHLAGQPKLASVDASGVEELSGIWSGLKIQGL